MDWGSPKESQIVETEIVRPLRKEIMSEESSQRTEELRRGGAGAWCNLYPAAAWEQEAVA